MTKNIFSFFAADVIAKGVSAALIPLYSHFLGPVELGMYSEWFTLYNVVVAIISFGIPTYLLVNLNSKPDNENDVINITATLFIELLIISLPVCLLVTTIVKSISFALTVSITAAGFTIVNYLEAYLRHKRQLSDYFKLQIASTISTNIIPLVFVVVTATWLSRVIGFSIAVTLLAIYIVSVASNKYSVVKLFNSQRYDALKFGLPVVAISAISWLKLGVDVQLLKGISGYRESGILFFSFQITSVLSILAASLTRSSTPDFLRILSNNDHRSFVKLFFRMTFFLTILTLLLVIITYVLVKTYLHEFRSSNIILLPMSAGIIFYAAGQFISVLFLHAKKTYLLTICIGTSSILHPAVSYYIIQHYGWTNIGYSYLISYIIFFAMVVSFAKRLTRFSLNYGTVLDGN